MQWRENKQTGEDRAGFGCCRGYGYKKSFWNGLSCDVRSGQLRYQSRILDPLRVSTRPSTADKLFYPLEPMHTHVMTQYQCCQGLQSHSAYSLPTSIARKQKEKNRELQTTVTTVYQTGAYAAHSTLWMKLLMNEFSFYSSCPLYRSMQAARIKPKIKSFEESSYTN